MRAWRSVTPGSRSSAGHTLLELVVSLSVLTIVLSSVGMAVNLIVSSHPAHAEERASAVDASRVAISLGADLRTAASFSFRALNATEFTVADRDGDGVDEKIRYTWSGKVGDPLQYRYNASAAVDVLPDVHAFELDYHIATTDVQPLEEEFVLIKHHDDAPDGHFHDRKLEAGKWCGQYFLPSLPVGVTEYKIKRVRIMAKREGDDKSGVFAVQITRAGNDQKPTDEVLDVARLYETDLDDSYTWIDVDFTSLNRLDPADGLCLVVAQVSASGSAAKIAYNHGGDPMTEGTHYITTDNGGGSWSGVVNDKDLRFYVLGTYENHVAAPREYLPAVSIRVRAGADPQGEVNTAVRLLNAPGVGP